MKIYCDCKNRKLETTCDKIRAGFSLSCDEACLNRQNEIKRAAEETERIKREKEMERNRLELEEFEKKFAKKKPKDRKTKIIEDTNDIELIKWICIGSAVGILAIFIGYLLIQ